jgi:hypothetical protein
VARYVVTFTFTLLLNGDRLMTCALFLIQWNWFGKKKKYAFDWGVMFWVSTGKTENIWMFVVESQYQVSSKATEDLIYVFVCLKTLYLVALSVLRL